MNFLKRITSNFSPELKGGVLIIFAMTIIGPNDTIIPFISKESGLWQFQFSRSLMAIIILLILFFIFRIKITVKNFRAVFLRTLFFTISMIIYFGSLVFIPIAVTGAGMFTAPIFVLIFSVLIYKEPIDKIKVLAVIIGSMGVWVVLDPSTSEFNIYSLFPIVGGAFLAMGNIATRKLCSDENPLILLFCFFISIGAIGFFMSSLFTIIEISQNNVFVESFIFIGWRYVPTNFWILVLIQALGSIIGVSLITKAYQSADTGYLNIFEYSFFISAGIAGWVILNQVLSTKIISGILLIIFSGIIASYGSQKRFIFSKKNNYI